MSVDHQQFLDRCRDLAPVLREGASDGETVRKIPDATWSAIRRADVLGVVLATSQGGHGLTLDSVCQGTRILAQGCPATAWTAAFYMQHAALLSRFPDGGRKDFFASDEVPLMAAPLAPTGTARPVDGGFTVKGRWDFATGIAHADWVMVHAIEKGPDFSTRFLVIPVPDVAVEDVWFTSGMRATGSNSVKVDGVFVPAERTVAAQSLFDGVGALDGDALADVPLVSVLALTASAAAVGAAEAAVDLYTQRLKERVLAYTLGDKAAEQPAAQIRLATVMSALATMRAGWDRAIATISDAAAQGSVTDQLRVDTKLAAAAAVRDARSIISLVGEGAGAAVYRSDHPFQRLQRDVETLKGHVIFDWDRAAELAGRVTLGAPLGPTDMA